MDSRFTVAVIEQSPNPQRSIYAAMHQDYSSEFVWRQRERFPSEEKCGKIIVDTLLKGDRGHYGPLEHPQIILNCGYFPHSTMQQLRTHRVGVSFDVQSFRYNSQGIIDVAKDKKVVDEIFYLRPVGEYRDRQGKRYIYTEEHRQLDMSICKDLAIHYRQRIVEGFAEEHARSLVPFDVRQHFVLSANVRSLMHILDLRWKKDAQLECQWFCDLVFLIFKEWAPEIADWYLENRAGKGRLSP